MNDIINTLLWVFLGGGVWAVLTRLNHYSNYPEDIRKKEDGKIHITWMVFINITAILTGGAISTVAFMVFKYANIASDVYLVFLSTIVGIGGDKLFMLLQNNIHRKADKFMDNDF